VAKRTMTMAVRISGVRETLAAFRKLPKDASTALREASGEIATFMVRKVKAASSIDRQSAAVGTTVRVARDRVPSVQAGGAKRVTSTRVPAWRLLIGSEFGANGRFGWYGAGKYEASEGRQFAPHTGRTGRWFFPTIEREQTEIARRWQGAADDIVTRFGRD